jgi:hypothetical protein
MTATSQIFGGRQAKGETFAARLREARENSQNFLKERDVAFIKANLDLSNAFLASKFGVDPSAVSRIRTGKAWRHVRAS